MPSDATSRRSQAADLAAVVVSALLVVTFGVSRVEAAPDRCDAAYCYEEVCKPGPPNRNCRKVPEKRCKMVTPRDCGSTRKCYPVPYVDCQPQYVEQCGAYNERVCRTHYRPQQVTQKECRETPPPPPSNGIYLRGMVCSDVVKIIRVPYEHCYNVPRKRCARQLTKNCQQKFRQECQQVALNCPPRRECWNEEREECTDGAPSKRCKTKKTKRECDPDERWTSDGCIKAVKNESDVAPSQGSKEPEQTATPAPAPPDPPPSPPPSDPPPSPPADPPPSSPPPSPPADHSPPGGAGPWDTTAALYGLGGLLAVGLLMASFKRRSPGLAELRAAGVDIGARIDRGVQTAATQSEPLAGLAMSIRTQAGPLHSSVARG